MFINIDVRVKAEVRFEQRFRLVRPAISTTLANPYVSFRVHDLVHLKNENGTGTFQKSSEFGLVSGVFTKEKKTTKLVRCMLVCQCPSAKSPPSLRQLSVAQRMQRMDLSSRHRFTNGHGCPGERRPDPNQSPLVNMWNCHLSSAGRSNAQICKWFYDFFFRRSIDQNIGGSTIRK